MEGHVVRDAIFIAICDVMDCAYSQNNLAQSIDY